MTKGSFTVEMIAKAFKMSNSAIRNEIRDRYPDRTSKGRQTVLTGAEAGRLIFELGGGNEQLQSREFGMLQKTLRNVEYIVTKLYPDPDEEEENDVYEEELDHEDLAFITDGLHMHFPTEDSVERFRGMAETFAAQSQPDKVDELVMPDNLKDAGVPDAITPDTRMSCRQFCVHQGLEVDRQQLGVYASRVGHANRISVERKVFEGVGHPISLWPMRIWVAAVNLLEQHPIEIER